MGISTKNKVTKAVLPVAGFGTRFLPATKSVPKEILPLVDRPLIQYTIDEARAAGITEFIFVTSRGKSALEDYFDSAPELETALRDGKKTKLLDVLKQTDMESGAVAYVRQQERRGLGHAVWCARRLIGDEPFAVLLPDMISRGSVRQMLDAYERHGGNIIAVEEVPEDQTHQYGIVSIGEDFGKTFEITGMVEKPPKGTAPSNLIISGRYILQPEIFGLLSSQEKGAGGEIQLTDSMKRLMESQKFYGMRYQGVTYDTGSKLGFLMANVAYGLERDDLGTAFRQEIEALLRRG
jgi:UTP--glucose-1-phosphate uridylyltransferase